MTYDDILVMPASREFDKLIASLVTDKEAHIVCPSCKGSVSGIKIAVSGKAEPVRFRCDETKGQYTCDWRFLACPLYTREMGAAWKVDDEMNRRNFSLLLRRGSGICTAEYYRADDHLSFTADALPGEVPLAICRAAFLAIGVLT